MGQQLCFTRRGTGLQSEQETSTAALPNYEQNKPFICRLKILKDQGGMLILQKCKQAESWPCILPLALPFTRMAD